MLVRNSAGLFKRAESQIQSAHTTVITAGTKIRWWVKIGHASLYYGRDRMRQLFRIDYRLSLKSLFNRQQAYRRHIHSAECQAYMPVKAVCHLYKSDDIQEGNIGGRAPNAHKGCGTARRLTRNDDLKNEFIRAARKIC